MRCFRRCLWRHRDGFSWWNPTDAFTDLEPQNPIINIFELHKFVERWALWLENGKKVGREMHLLGINQGSY